MAIAKITIILDDNIIKQLDRMAGRKVFPNRSKAIQEAVKQKLSRMDRNRLARECTNLDLSFEQTLAEGGILLEDSELPEC
jgi:metal-responsive CopG/Arc/MetJ family transcriptional regulator